VTIATDGWFLAARADHRRAADVDLLDALVGAAPEPTVCTNG
jgi:hypothetical protein